MKKLFTLLTTLFIITTIVSGCGASKTKSSIDNSMQEVKEQGEFIVGLDDSFPPMGFRDENGEIVGFDIDLAKEAAKRMGVNVIFKPVDWDGIVLSLKNDDIDIIWNGLTITEKRKEAMGFTNSYLKNRQIIIVLKDSNIKSKDDFNDKIIGVQLGSSSDEALTNDETTLEKLKEVRKYSNNTEALMDLKAERIQAVVVDEVVGRYYISKMPNVYDVLEDNFGSEEYGVGYRKEDISFGEELNKFLSEMKDDGTADEIYIKWFGSEPKEK